MNNAQKKSQKKLFGYIIQNLITESKNIDNNFSQLPESRLVIIQNNSKPQLIRKYVRQRNYGSKTGNHYNTRKKKYKYIKTSKKNNKTNNKTNSKTKQINNANNLDPNIAILEQNQVLEDEDEEDNFREKN